MTSTVIAVGIASTALAGRMSMNESALIPVDQNGLSRCVQGRLVCEDDIAAVQFSLSAAARRGGLRSLVAAPLQIKHQVFEVLIAARRPSRERQRWRP